ncbi:mitogen-activated protein kinase organizer 1 [Fistulifera solaris]|uniref:Mitogen-activated protein kinase organizer 1 n=1 Tax=Fistulifera solaris TaxID=1519565 RepID=A0A1Z5KR32_FISSO|nr:mitogen-activated protein kinase organizer 1 [Fistulifera solaris]|eukprot:GAX28562.1 mitogen-activated protein kinase organizer 1 [Fistulifera solaris]
MKVLNPKAPVKYPSCPVSRLVGHEGPAQTICFTNDGKYCLTGGVDRKVRLWNPSRLDPAFPPRPWAGGDDIPIDAIPRALPIQVYEDGITHPISALAIDEKSTTIASASEKTVVVSDVVTKQAKRRLQGHSGRVNAVAISTDSETFLSASYDATVRIWDGRSRSYEPIQILKEAKDSVTDVHKVQNDNEALIRTASVDGIVRTYDLRKGILRCDDFSSPITSMAQTHDGQYLVVSCLDGTIRLMEVNSGELVNTYDKHHAAGQYGLMCGVTADDSTIITGSEDGQCILYDLVHGTCVQSLMGHTRPTCAVAVHPKSSNNSVVITASYDGNVIVWANSPDYMRWQE